MKALIASIATALLTAGAALGFGAPWQDYTEGPQRCAIVDPLSQQVTIVRLAGGTHVVSYEVAIAPGGAQIARFDGHVPRFARELVGDGSTSYSLRRACRG